MATTVLLAPVGAGKTEAALNALDQTVRAHRPARGMPRLWVLLASRRQEYAFRERLAQHLEVAPLDGVIFNLEFFNFYQLSHRLLQLAGQPPRRIHSAAALTLLRHILLDLKAQGRLSLFASIAHTPGFLQTVAAFIVELKQQRIWPQQLQEAAHTDKDHELALIYAAYQAGLQMHNLADREGETWLALKALEEKPNLASDIALLLADGYDQFTPVQASLLTQLAGRVEQTVVTLTALPEPHQRLGLRFQQALARLEATHHALDVPLSRQVLTVNPERHPDLRALAEGVVAPPAQKATPDSPSRVRLIEAPEPAQEAAAVLREVKRLLYAGVRPDDILIVVRDWPLYASAIETYGRLYKLPLLREHASDLRENPALALLLDVLRLADGPPARRFERRTLLDVLRSPYVMAEDLDTPDALDLLDRVSRRYGVISGLHEWHQALDAAAGQSVELEEDEPAEPLLNSAQAATLSLALETFCHGVTPPAEATATDYVDWLERLIGPDPESERDDAAQWPDSPFCLNLLTNIHAMDADVDDDELGALTRRDVSAVSSLRGLLVGLRESEALLRSLNVPQRMITWGEFYQQLQMALSASNHFALRPDRTGRVLVTGAVEARGLPHAHVFIMGLSEGVFPAPTPEDPLYLDSEREALRERGVNLRSRAERGDDEGLYYELISLPRYSLILSRPTVRDGKPWSASHLWQRTLAAYAPNSLTHRRYRVGEVPSADEVAALDEALLAAVSDEDAAPLRGWLMAKHGPQWQVVQQAITIEQGRLSSARHDAYSGHLQHVLTRQHVARTLADTRRWSAGQLNEYGLCPYGFFARRLLHLEEWEEPQVGMDARQLGSVFHAILEKAYGQIQQAGMAIMPENANEALEIFEDVATYIFKDAPQAYGFRPAVGWRQQQALMRRRLRALLVKDFSDESPLRQLSHQPRKVYALEQRFGFQRPLSIPIGAGETVGKLPVRGVIDRIDRAGDALIIVDYKSGSTQIPLSEIQEGRNFQMAVYILALRELLRESDEALTVAGGLFWHIRDLRHSGLMDFAHDTADEHEAVILRAQRHIARYIDLARQGRYAPQASKMVDGKCSRYCAYYQLCRLSMTHQHKHTDG